MSEKGWVPYNGKSTTISRVIESLIVAGIVGAISVWGMSLRLETKMQNLCDSVSELKAAASEMRTFMLSSTVDRTLLHSELKALDGKLQAHSDYTKK